MELELGVLRCPLSFWANNLSTRPRVNPFQALNFGV